MAAKKKKGAKPRPEPPSPTTATVQPRSIGEFEVHPYRRFIPEMSPERLDQFIEDVKVDGPAFDPILVDSRNRILDGRARARVCLRLGIPVETRPYQGPEDDIARLMLRELVRNDLTSAQRALIALNMLPPLKKEARERQCRGREVPQKIAEEDRHLLSDDEGEAMEIAARRAGSDREYLRQMKIAVDRDWAIEDLVHRGLIEKVPHAFGIAQLSDRKLKNAIEGIRAGDDPRDHVPKTPKPADDHWLTPLDIVEALRAVWHGEIVCDPCSGPGSFVNATHTYVLPPEEQSQSENTADTKRSAKKKSRTKRDRNTMVGGLDPNNPWYDRTFCNPPFSNAEPWVQRALKEANNYKRIYILLPVRPDSTHQSRLIRRSEDVLLLGERIVFGKPGEQRSETGKISVMICALGPNCSVRDLVEVGLHGTIVRPWEAVSRPDTDEGYESSQLLDNAFPVDPETAGAFAEIDQDPEYVQMLDEMAVEFAEHERWIERGRENVESARRPKPVRDPASNGTLIANAKDMEGVLDAASRIAGERHGEEVVLESDGHDVRLTATDGYRRLEMRLFFATEQPFRCVLPAESVATIQKHLDDAGPQHEARIDFITEACGVLTINETGRDKFDVCVGEPDLAAKPCALPEGRTYRDLSRSDFLATLRRSKYANGPDGSIAAIHEVRFPKVQNPTLRLGTMEDASVLLPRSALLEILQAMKSAEVTVTLRGQDQPITIEGRRERVLLAPYRIMEKNDDSAKIFVQYSLLEHDDDPERRLHAALDLVKANIPPGKRGKGGIFKKDDVVIVRGTTENVGQEYNKSDVHYLQKVLRETGLLMSDGAAEGALKRYMENQGVSEIAVPF